MQKFLSALKRVADGFNWIALAITLPALCLIVTVNVFMRYIIRSPILGSDEITGIFFSLVVFFSLAHCWMADGHIRTEMVVSRLGRRWRAILNLMAEVIALVFSGVLTYAIFRETEEYIHFHKISMDASIPLWPFTGLAFVGSMILCLAILTSLLLSITRLFGERR